MPLAYISQMKCYMMIVCCVRLCEWIKFNHSSWVSVVNRQTLHIPWLWIFQFAVEFYTALNTSDYESILNQNCMYQKLPRMSRSDHSIHNINDEFDTADQVQTPTSPIKYIHFSIIIHLIRGECFFSAFFFSWNCAKWLLILRPEWIRIKRAICVT